MAVYLRGKVYWAEYSINGAKQRFSTKCKDEKSALKVLDAHRQERINKAFRVRDTKIQLTTFVEAFRKFVEDNKINWSKATLDMHEDGFKHLKSYFGAMIIHEITEDDLIDYRNKRKAETFSPSNRTINMEIGTLRQVLKKNRLWLALMEGSDFRNLKENKDVGRELTEEEAARLLLACAKSFSQAIYAAVKLAIYTGMRSAELKRVQWKHVDFEAAILTVGKSKTEAGSGREIHLNRNAVVLLQQRQEIFPGAKGEHYVFPSQQYTWKTLKGGTGRGTGVLVVGKTFLDRPITKLDSAWYRCLEVANVKCRWHDLRHTAASIMAAAGASDQVLLAHFGWMSRKMIERYSHVRAQAKKQAVAAAFDNWNVEQMLHLPETAAIIQ